VISFFFLERFLLWFHHHDEGHGEKPTATLVITGDALHNLIDGVAVAASFIINPALGVATTLAIAAHEIPQEIADFSVLLHAGFSKTKALWSNFLSALMALISKSRGLITNIPSFYWRNVYLRCLFRFNSRFA
jgi:zinc and cadmium transporter